MFEVKIKITNDQVAGLLCSAMDLGAINYWACLTKLTKPKKPAEFTGDWNDYKRYSYPLGQGGSIEIEDVHTKKVYTLNRKAIQEGLQLMQEKYPQHFSNLLSQDDDSETGDVFMQLCLFGDVIYG